MNLDPTVLARIQFAFTVSFHIIFPTISIGLATFLAIMEGLWLKTKDPLYLQIYRFWLGIFAMGFGVGVVTGIVLSFEFGLSFARFGQMAGPAIGPMIGLEVLTSFFWKPGSLASCCSASTGSDRSFTSSPPAWLRSARCYRHRGSSQPTAGCKPLTAWWSNTAGSW